MASIEKMMVYIRIHEQIGKLNRGKIQDESLEKLRWDPEDTGRPARARTHARSESDEREVWTVARSPSRSPTKPVGALYVARVSQSGTAGLLLPESEK